jgi:hypothetical protein
VLLGPAKLRLHIAHRVVALAHALARQSDRRPTGHATPIEMIERGACGARRREPARAAKGRDRAFCGPGARTRSLHSLYFDAKSHPIPARDRPSRERLCRSRQQTARSVLGFLQDATRARERAQ